LPISIEETPIRAVARAIDFIEDSLKEEIGIADAAYAASYSLYHFCRLFNRYVHHSPYDYLIRRRLTEAALELKETDRKIIDIAFDYQFNSHEAFCRAFKRFTGMQPKEWRKKGIRDDRFVLSRRTIEHLELIGGNILTRPRLTERKDSFLAGISSLMGASGEYDRSIWQKLERELASIRNRTKPTSFYGIRTRQDERERDSTYYTAAVEVETLEGISPVMTIRIIPACTCLVFDTSGPLRPALDYIYQTHMPKLGMRPAYPLEIEVMGEDWRRGSPEGARREFLIPVG